MLAIRLSETGRVAPRLTCDRCHEAIEDYQMAGVAWHYPPSEIERPAYVFFEVLCKTRRCLALTLDEASETRPWMELGHFLVHLLSNVGMTEDRLTKVVESAYRLTQLG